MKLLLGMATAGIGIITAHVPRWFMEPTQPERWVVLGLGMLIAFGGLAVACSDTE